MKRPTLERIIAAALFILVFVAFSFAESDSKELDKFYNQSSANTHSTFQFSDNNDASLITTPKATIDLSRLFNDPLTTEKELSMR